jgi:transposase InsO family protein
MQEEKVVCDVSTSQPRPIIPVVDHRDVFRAIHELTHASIRATQRIMAAQVVWRGMASDMAAWCRDCQLCAHDNASPQHTAPVQPIPIPEQRFTHVHVDLVGHLPTSVEGFKYLFTMVDRSSRWLEATPLQTMAAEDFVDALISTWVTRFGVPTIITSDQGRQFTSSLWAGLTKLLGIKHLQTTAYHPQFNRMVERTHGQLNAALRARLAGSRWPEHLPWVLLGLLPRKKTVASRRPSWCTGRRWRYQPNFCPQRSRRPPSSSRSSSRSRYQPPDPSPTPKRQASRVYLPRGGTLPPLALLYVGPYEVLERADKSFRLAVGGRKETVSIDHLKPNLGVGPFSAALPVARGCPPAPAPVVVQPQHPPAAATRGGTVMEDINM